jgi:hypothetical protein
MGRPVPGPDEAGAAADPPVSDTKASQAGFGSRSWVKRPVWKNQMLPGTSLHEYQITPGMWRRPRFAASIPKDFRRYEA